MQWEVDARPSYSVLKLNLSPGESVIAEPGAMLLMKGGIEVQTGTKGGLFQSLIRSVFGGESLFMNTYYAQDVSELWLAPSLPGDIHYLPLQGEGYVIQDSSFLSCHGEVNLDIAWRGFKGWLTEGELIWLRARGYGGVWVNAFGGIDEVQVFEGESLTVDNFHFVAMEEGTQYNIHTFGGIKSFIFGGEGLVAEVYGPARLWVQTRQIASLANNLLPILRQHLKS